MFDVILQRMPLNAAGSLTERQAIELVAYILQRNGVQSGQAPLTRDGLSIHLVLGSSDAMPDRQPAAAGLPSARPTSFPVPAPTVARSRGAAPDDSALLQTRPDDWPLVNGDLRSQRFSRLAQITTGNAARLTAVCMLQLGDPGSFEARPVVFQGRMYLTTVHKTIAVNASTCARLWEHTYVPKDIEPLPNNRGVALYKGKVFRGTADGHLLALDADTGALLWDVWVADSQKRYFVNGAPLALGGKVFVGEGGADFGIDGRIHAFDAETGTHLWAFDTIAKHDPKSWPPGTTGGGGGSWSSMSFDAAAGLLYVPTGNPWPDFDAKVRPGDNLYTDSVVALHADTGKLAWYVQQVPHDEHDWDAPAAPVLYDLNNRRMMSLASKNGRLYLYDRDTHGTVATSPITRIENDTVPITAEGVHVCPGVNGGANYNGHAYNPTSQRLFVGTIDWCYTFFDGKRIQADPLDQAFGWIRSLDAATGRELWARRTPTPMVAGVTSTAGGVLLTGDLDGNFLVLNARTGDELYRFGTGGPIGGSVITYSVNGKQYVAVPSGNISRGVTWRTTVGSPTLVVFALP